MTTVAVIGGGAAGIGAARTLLQADLDVLLFEAAPRLGGNCLGLDVHGDDGRPWAVDVGVSDFNRTTFTEFSGLIDDLGLPTRPIGTDTSFATLDGRIVASCREGAWRFGADGGARADLVAEIEQFRCRATEVLDDDRFAGWTVGRYLDHLESSREFRDVYLLPRAIGCFPMPDCPPEELPLRGLIEFWRIHGVVGTAPANRHCVLGGMNKYPAAFADWFRSRGGELFCGTRVSGIARHREHVELAVVDRDDRHRRFEVDQVIVTGHPHEAVPMLHSPASEEVAALTRFVRQRARVVVHRDASVVGDDRAALGAFNYVVPEGTLPRVKPTITFFPNRLGKLPAEVPDVFVTMNPHREPERDAIVAERYFSHPVFCRSHRTAVTRLDAMQGRRRTWYAGAHLQSPFVHESALRSGQRAAQGLIAAESQQRRQTVDLALA